MENILEAGVIPLKWCEELQGFDISKDGTKAYIAERDGLKMLNISDPTDTYQVGGYFYTDGIANNVTVSKDGTKAYIADDSNGVVIVDISDKNKLSVISSIVMWNTEDIALSEDENTLVSVGTTEELVSHLTIFDVSDPAKPTKLGSYKIDDSTFGVELSKDGTKAYLARFGALVIVDISDPSKPTKIGELEIKDDSFVSVGCIFGIAISKDETKAYIATSDIGILVVDISDPSKPTKISEHPDFQYGCSIKLDEDGTKIYVAGFDDDEWNSFIAMFDIDKEN